MPFFRIKLSLFLLIFTCSLAYSQRSGLSQVVFGDTAYYNAYVNFPESWPADVLIRFPGRDFYERFQAGDVTHMVIATDEIFNAKPMTMPDGSSKQVFMQLLSDGDVDLYYSEAGPYSFHIQKEDFIPLSRNNYRDIILGLVNEDPLAHEGAQKVLYRKSSIRHFFKQYNSGRMHERPFPMPHAGLFVQFNNMRWNVPRHALTNVAFNSFDLQLSHFSPGLFVHVPFYQPKRLGLDLRFAAHSYETAATVDESLTGSYYKDVYFENSLLQADLAMRYTIGWKRIEAYIAGGVSYIHSAKQHSRVYYYIIQDGVVSNHYREDSYDEPSLMFGALAYQGVQYYVWPRTLLAAEWGYGRYLDVSGSGYGMNKLFVNMRINFWPW